MFSSSKINKSAFELLKGYSDKKNDLPIFKYYRNNDKILDEEIQTIEKSLNIKFPEDYRNFLLKYNGGQPIPSSFHTPKSKKYCTIDIEYFYSLKDACTELEVYIYKPRGRTKWFPIANDGGGNNICIGLDDKIYGKIYYYEYHYEYNPCVFLSPSIQELFNGYLYNHIDDFDIFLYKNDFVRIRKLLKNISLDKRFYQELLNLSQDYYESEKINKHELNKLISYLKNRLDCS